MKKVFILGLVFISIFNFTAFANDGAVFEKQKAYNGEFYDISENDWFYNNVVTSYEYGMMTGKSENSFMPDDNISYAEVITLACRLHTKYKNISYNFSSEGLWYEPFLLYAKNNGIIKQSFNLSQAELPATRADAINILITSIPKEHLKNENPYIGKVFDMPETQKGYSAVLTAVKSGIINGKDANGSVYPDMPVIRAEISAILERIMFPDKRTSQVRDFYEKREDNLDFTEFYVENQYIPNYGCVNDTRYLSCLQYTSGHSMYVYEYNQKAIQKFEAMLGNSTSGSSLSTNIWDDKTYSIKNHEIRVLKTKDYNMMIVIFEWDKDYYNDFQSKMSNTEKEDTESDTTINVEAYDRSERYLENSKVPNFGKLNNITSLYHENYFDKVTKTKYVYDFYPIESMNYCIELLNMDYKQGVSDGNRLFWKADFTNRTETITVFMNFMEDTLEISFAKKEN